MTKKSLLILTVLMITIMSLSTVVFASTATTADEIYAIGVKYGMTSAQEVQLERVLESSDLTDVELASIVTKAETVAAVMDEEGVTSYSELSDAKKSEVTSIANEAATIAGVTITVSDSAVNVYKDGTLLETVTASETLAYTGNTTNILVINSLVVAMISLIIVALFVKIVKNK